MEQNTNDPFEFLANALRNAKNEEQIKNKDVTVERKGSAIILPNDPREMTIAEAKAHLTRIEEQEDKKMSISETIGQAWPLEGAYFLMEYLKEKYGWVNSVDTPGFFGTKPPTMMDLEIGFGKKTQVIWGSFEIPNIDGRFETGYNIEDGRVVFRITGTAKKKHEKEIKAIADGLREKISKKSLCRN